MNSPNIAEILDILPQLQLSGAEEKHIYLWKLKYAIRFEKLFWWNWPVSLHLSELIREFFDLDSLPNNVKEFLRSAALGNKHKLDEGST